MTVEAGVVHIRKGDFVTVLSGRDRGKTGRVVSVHPKARTAVVEKIGVQKKVVRPTQQNPQGGIQDVERPLPVSRLMLVCVHCRRPTRYKRVRLPSGAKVRVCRHCHEHIDKE